MPRQFYSTSNSNPFFSQRGNISPVSQGPITPANPALSPKVPAKPRQATAQNVLSILNNMGGTMPINGGIHGVKQAIESKDFAPYVDQAKKILRGPKIESIAEPVAPKILPSVFAGAGIGSLAGVPATMGAHYLAKKYKLARILGKFRKYLPSSFVRGGLVSQTPTAIGGYLGYKSTAGATTQYQTALKTYQDKVNALAKQLLEEQNRKDRLTVSNEKSSACKNKKAKKKLFKMSSVEKLAIDLADMRFDAPPLDLQRAIMLNRLKAIGRTAGIGGVIGAGYGAGKEFFDSKKEDRKMRLSSILKNSLLGAGIGAGAHLGVNYLNNSTARADAQGYIDWAKGNFLGR